MRRLRERVRAARVVTRDLALHQCGAFTRHTRRFARAPHARHAGPLRRIHRHATALDIAPHQPRELDVGHEPVAAAEEVAGHRPGTPAIR